jgi:CRP/FNR family cyclic AMP-dependent transcriptional regulator
MDTDVFRHIPLFSELDATERADLSRLLRPRVLAPQETLFWFGEVGHEFYIIEAGEVVIAVTGDDGKEVTIGRLGPGEFFGELSLLDGGRRTATARAVGDARLLSLDRPEFHQFIQAHPTSAIHVLTQLGRRQRENLERLRGIKNVNDVVEERQTPVQRFAERVARMFASEVFLLANMLFISAWIVFQKIRYDVAVERKLAPPYNFLDQPPTFFWLGFMVTIEGLMLSIFVLNAQRRQAQRDAIKADLDYQVNRKAQAEIMKLHEKVDALAAAVKEHGPAGGGKHE